MAANNYVKVIERTVRVLEAFNGERELPLHMLSARTGLVKSSVYRILFTLQRLGYIEKTPQGRYSIATQFRQLAGAPAEPWDLRELAEPFMRALVQRFQETVNLGILDGGEVSYIRVVESPQALRLAAHAGMRSPVHSTALGKCLLAFCPRTEADGILRQRPLRPRTERTIRDRLTLYRELERVRARGYAVDNEEDSHGARCVAAPILNASSKAMVAMSISGPASRIRPSRDRELAEALMESCRQISVLLGFKPELAALPNAGD